MNRNSHSDSPASPTTNDQPPAKDTNASPEAGSDSIFASMYQSMVYGISLPERTVRSVAALASGAAGESAALLVPAAFQDSKSYQLFVGQMLDMLSQDVGGVKQETKDNKTSPASGENYIAKKTVGTFIDLAGLSMMHVSPLTVLAIVSDVAHGSKFYIQQLARELEDQGVIDQASSIHGTAELLAAIGTASGSAADEIDTPPVDLQGLTDTIERTRQQIAEIDPAKLIPQSEITALWNDMGKLASTEDVSLFQLSSAMTMYSLNQISNVSQGTLVTIRVTGDLVNRHLFDHYRSALDKIADQGIYTVLATSSKPYVDALWYNFAADRPTVTEDLINGKLIGKAIDGISGWIGGESPDADKSSGD